MIIHSEDFQQFMDRAGRIMERALSENVDIYTDYTGALDENDVKLVPNLFEWIFIIIKLIMFKTILVKIKVVPVYHWPVFFMMNIGLKIV